VKLTFTVYSSLVLKSVGGYEPEGAKIIVLVYPKPGKKLKNILLKCFRYFPCLFSKSLTLYFSNNNYVFGDFYVYLFRTICPGESLLSTNFCSSWAKDFIIVNLLVGFAVSY